MPQNAIVLIVDRLRASALGAYGNTWFETPRLDDLAGESFVFDQMLIDSPRLERLYRSYLTGKHALQPDQSPIASSLVALLHNATQRRPAVATTLITDERLLVNTPFAEAFGELIDLADGGPPEQPSPSQPPAAESPATEPPAAARDAPEVAHRIEATRQARLWEAGAYWLAEEEAADADEADRSPFLLWIHAQGMAGPWDAPLELRNALVEEDDPAPPQNAAVPNRMLPADFDPDEIHGAACAYAGQVIALDACLGALLEPFRESRLSDNTLIVLLSLRGFPLGEHGRLGPNDEPLHEELVHVPCLVRLPGGEGAMARSQRLVQPADLFPTLLDWFGRDPPRVATAGESWLPTIRGDSPAAEAVRPCAIISGQQRERGLRTPLWYLVSDTQKETTHESAGKTQKHSAPQLYTKPDDRWEQNEISDRAGDVVESLVAAMKELEESIAENRPLSQPDLDESLVASPV